MIKTHSAGGVVINNQGQVLVASQGGTSWSLPKGHIEDGEDTRQAAAREIEEETGLTQLDFTKELGSYQRHRIAKGGGEDRSELKTITMLLFRTDEEKLQPIDPENPEARWVDRDQIEALLTHPADKEFFAKIKSEIDS